jgi:hypothetical protein
MAVDYIQVVGLVGFACGRGPFQAFLRRFLGVSNAILAVLPDFAGFEAWGTP